MGLKIMDTITIPRMYLMPKFRVILKGFSGEDLYTLTTPAQSRTHAVKIAAAVYNSCYRNSEVKEV